MSPSILLVEDSRSWQLIYKAALSHEGYEVDVATSKAEALQKLDGTPFDVAIVDLKLVDTDPSNMDGIEVIRHLRRFNRTTHVIVKSGYLTDEARNELNDLKVEGIFDKSSKNRELVELVAKFRP